MANRSTAVTKTERLLANTKLANQFGTVFDSLKLVRPGSFLNVDHSDLHGLMTLVAAIQTRKGRAIPCMMETTYALHLPAEGSANRTPCWDTLRTDM